MLSVRDARSPWEMKVHTECVSVDFDGELLFQKQHIAVQSGHDEVNFPHDNFVVLLRKSDFHQVMDQVRRRL